MGANRLNKPLISANFKVFIKMTRVKDKKDFLALIERKKELKNIF